MEQNTDDILNNPEKSDKSKHKSQEEIEETVSTRKFLFSISFQHVLCDLNYLAQST